MTLIVVAMMREIEAFITDAKLVEKEFYPVYKKDDVFIIISGIGRTNAAGATSYMLTKYPKTKRVINIGFAGATIPAKVKDVYEINKAYYGDFNLTDFGYAKGQVPNMPEYFTLSNTNLYERKNLYTSEWFTKNASFEDVTLFDMEGAAVAQVCHIFSKPLYMFKVVSDVTGEENIESYNEFSKEGDRQVFFVLNKVLGVLE